MLKKIDKTISRDLPLINIYAWHRGYTIGLKNWLGWSYSDSVFYIHDGFADIMRPPQEHLVEFKEYIAKKMEAEPQWFYDEVEKFKTDIAKIFEFYKPLEESITSYNKQDILKTYETYVDYIEKIIGPFITMIWFPIWAESDTSLQQKFSKEIEKAIEMRILSEQVFPKGDVIINILLKKVQDEIGLNDSQIRVLSKEEFIKFLSEGALPDKNELDSRLTGMIYCNKGIIVTGQNKEKIEETFRSIGFEYTIEDYSDISEVKGMPACKGVVRGTVRVLMSKAKIGDMLDGEVLVASMTTPEYLPAMKKAVAFITDEGGITCHAAIVAREMNRPCIIGTKIATKVFKDGDVVEVDANTGIVRKIN